MTDAEERREEKPAEPGRQTALSEAAREQLRRALAPGEALRVAAEADLTLDGVFAPSWLVMTDRRLAVFTSNGNTPHKQTELSLRPDLRIKKRAFASNSLLEAQIGEATIPLLRFTHACDEAMERAVKAIEEEVARLAPRPRSSAPFPGAVRAGAPDGGGPRPGAHAPVCPECGKPVPRRLGVCPDCVDRRALLLRLLQRLRPYALPASLAFGLALLASGMDLAQAPLQRLLVDEVLPNRDMRGLGLIFLLLVCLRGGMALLSAARTFIMSAVGEQLTYDLRRDVYDHLQSLSISYYDQKDTGWIMDRITSDTGNLQQFMTDGFQRTVLNIVTCLVIVVMMLAMNWHLALLSLLPAPLVVVMSARFMARTRKLYHWNWRRRSAVFTLLSNVIPGVRVVRAFAQEPREQDRFRRRSATFRDASIQVARTFAGFSRSTGFLIALSSLIIWGYGGYLVIVDAPGASVGTLVAFMTLVHRFYSPLQDLTQLSRQIQQASTSAQRVFEVLDTRPELANAPDARPMPPIEGRVRFRNVSFSYDGRNPVLQDVSFTVEPGEMIGLVGPSGAGKSTTINLLCRFYDVTSGAIEIDGIDIREVELRSLREQIGIVLQEPFLFHGTIAENIAYGRPDATLEEIIAAARAANAHEFIIRLPDGYETLVGERGARLSGGERQRISIARAILKNPRILIFDEATASVDTETEQKIREAIDRLVAGRTTFAIAHRFSTLKNADRLIVLDRGRVVEIGTHEELMAREEGLFRRLCEMQSEMSKIVAVGG